MRNLKRVLSLALASVMLLGMMVIGAGAADKTAADLTDMDKVTNTEAVTLMVDLGIIVGKPDGSYAPTEGVDRATMAKLITYILMGDVDAAIFEGTTTDLKDIDTSWAEGYIKYCYSNGIISGDGLGHFFPTQGVTVVQAAKMLLTALGYESDDRGYQGNANWSTNIMRDAQTNGLMNNINAKATDTLTRDNAAQMIFNALFANTVEPKYAYDMGVQYVSEYTKGQTLGQQAYGLVKVTATVEGIVSGKATLASPAVNGTAVTVSGTAITGKLPATPDMLNTSVNLYVKGTTTTSGGTTTLKVDSIYSTSLVVASDNTVATVTGYTSTGDTALTALLSTAATKVASLESGKGLNDLKYFYNGVNLTDVTSPNKAGIDTESEARGRVGENGVIVEFKDLNTTPGVDTVVITEKKVTTLATAPVLTTSSTGAAEVTISSLGLNKVSPDTVVGYENLAKGDVVLSVTVGDVTYIEKAASVKGVASAKNNYNAILVDGTYYGTSALSGSTFNGASWSDYKNTYTFYLDNGNNIVKAVAEENATTTQNYAVLLGTGWVGTGTEIGGTSYGQAQLLFADGTVEVVKLSKVDGSTVVKSGASSGQVNYNALATDVFYTYTVSNDSYSLTKVNASAANINGTTITNQIKFDGNNVGNNATVFLVKSGSASSPVYTAYTGIANVPAMTGVTNGKTDIVTVNGVAAYVYVTATSATVTGSVGEYIYIPSKASYNEYPATSTSSAYIEVSGVVEGQTVAVKFATGNNIKIDNNTGKSFASDVAAQTLYEVKAKDANGIITEISAVTTNTGINVASGGTLSVGSPASVYNYDANTVVYYFAKADGTCTVQSYDTLTVDATDKVVVVSADGKHADAVYVMQEISNTATASAIKYSVDNGVATSAAGTSGTVAETTAAGTAGKTVKITDVTVAPGATYTVSGTAVVQANGTAAGAANTITITVIAEDGLTSTQITLTFVAGV